MTDKDIRIEIKAESSKASAEIKKLTRDIDKMNKRIREGGVGSATQVGQMTRSFKSLTAHVSKLALIYGSFKTLMTGTVITAQFEQSIQKLGIYSGASAEELGLLEEKAKELGESTIFSASQVAEGMNEMALAGLSSEDMLAGIGDTLNLASVGMLSLKEATDYTVTSMKTYGLKATDMNDITDIFAKGSTISATTVTQLGQALTKVGAVASTYNVSLEETTALLGVLADGGRRASEAGTQLKISMLRLASNPEAKKYLDKLKISMYGLEVQADGTTKKALLPFTEQLRIVRDALKELDAEARNEAMARIFGTEAVATAQILMDNLEEVHSKLAKIKDAMQNDFATTSAQLMMDTLVGSFKNLMSALEGLAIKIVGEMTPALREMLDTWTEVIRGMDSDALGDVSEGLGNMIAFLGNIVSVLATVGGATMTWSSANKELSKTLGTLAVAILVIRRNALMTDKALLALARNPYFILLTAGIITIDLTVDALEAQNKALKKVANTLKETADRQTSYNDKLDKALNSSTGEIGKNNFEKLIFIKQTEDAIGALKKEIDAVSESRTIGDRKTKQLKKLWEEYYRLKDFIKLVTGQIKEETVAEKKATDAKIKAYEATDKAKENYTDYTKALDKGISSIEKSYNKEQKALDKLKISHAKLRREMLANEKKYADELNQISEDYEQLEYDANTKNLSEHKKYLADKARAVELSKKAEEAFDDGRLAEASRYYAEAKSLATSFAGSVIKENDKILVSEKQTRKEALSIYETTQAGEKKLIAEKRRLEKEANIAKLDFIEFEMEATIAQVEVMGFVLKALKDYKKEAGENINPFDDDGYLQEKLKELKGLRDGIKDFSKNAKLRLNKSKFDNDMKEVEGDIKKIDSKPASVDVEINTKQIDKATEKVYKLKKTMQQDVDGIRSEVWVVVEGEKEVEKLKSSIIEVKDAGGNPINMYVDSRDLVEANDHIKDIKTGISEPLILSVKSDNKEVEKTKESVKEVGRLTIGEYTVKIGADTTPADFDIPKYIQNVSENKKGDIKFGADIDEAKTEVEKWKAEVADEKNTTPLLAELNLEKAEARLAELKESNKYSVKTIVNPEFTKAEKLIADFGKKEEKKPIKKKVEVKTDDISKEVDKEEKKIESKPPIEIKVTAETSKAITESTTATTAINAMQGFIKVSSDPSGAVSEVNALVDWINTQKAYVHTYEVWHPARAGGGYIQKLADGGQFTGSGRVSGYDPTDSDSVNAKLTGGEYVINRTATDFIGIGVLDAINAMKFDKPKGYAEGGVVGENTVSRNISLNFMDDNGSAMATMTDEATAQKIENYFRKYAQ